MGTAISKSHTSRHDFTIHCDKVGVALTVLSLRRFRHMKILGLAIALTFFWLASPAAGPRRAGQPEIRIADLERRVHELINSARREHDLAALTYDERLAKVARGHSQDMATRHFFSHTNPDGLDPTARGKLAGVTCRKQMSANSFREGLGENLYQDNLYSRIHISGSERSYDWNSPDDLAANSLRGWMNSPPHRHNILEKIYSQTGIGIAISDDDKVFITQLFC
jgi:uncharacterized protein YkwD